MRSTRIGAGLVLAVAALSLPGCPAFTSMLKTVGIVKPPHLELTETLPPDFELTIHVTDQAQPSADYLLRYARNGKCTYEVKMRAPSRKERTGKFEILENQVKALYDTVRKNRYEQLDERYPSDGDGVHKELGVQAFNVRANDLSKEVQAHFYSVPELEKVRALAMSFVPEQALADANVAAPVVTGESTQVIGDLGSHLFFYADDARVKDVPVERRQPFPTWQDAVNHEFYPAVGVKCGKRTE